MEGRKFISGIGWSVIGAILVLFIVSAAIVFWGTVKHDFIEHNDRIPYKRSELNVTTFHVSADSALKLTAKGKGYAKILTPAQSAKLDSVLDSIIARQSEIIERQESVIDDIRQETNNNLVKLDSWLSFWVAIMVVLGTILPIALSLYSWHKDEELRKQLQQEVNDKVYDVTRKYRMELRQHAVENAAYAIRAGIRSSLLSTMGEGPRLMSKLLGDLNTNFNELCDNLLRRDNTLNEVEAGKIERQERLVLISVLTGISDSLDALSLESDIWNLREISSSRDDIRIILNLLADKPTDDPKVAVKLADLKTHLSNISAR